MIVKQDLSDFKLSTYNLFFVFYLYLSLQVFIIFLLSVLFLLWTPQKIIKDMKKKSKEKKNPLKSLTSVTSSPFTATINPPVTKNQRVYRNPQAPKNSTSVFLTTAKNSTKNKKRPLPPSSGNLK